MSAIFGPSDDNAAVHAENICDTMEIPYIDTRYNAYASIPIISMYADPSTLAEVINDLIQAAQWQSFTILYETPEWLPHLSNLLALYDPKGDTVTVKRIDVSLTDEKNYRSVLREVKQSSEKCIIIDCSIESLGEILKQAQQVGLLVDDYQIILTNLDAHTIDLEPYQHGGANITTISMVDAASESMTAYAEYMKKKAAEDKKEKKVEGEGEGEGEESADAEPKNEENADGGEAAAAPEDAKENVEDGEESKTDEGGNEEEQKSDEKKEEEEDEVEGRPTQVPPYSTYHNHLFIFLFRVDFNTESVRLQTALIHDGIVLLTDAMKVSFEFDLFYVNFQSNHFELYLLRDSSNLASIKSNRAVYLARTTVPPGKKDWAFRILWEM